MPTSNDWVDYCSGSIMRVIGYTYTYINKYIYINMWVVMMGYTTAYMDQAHNKVPLTGNIYIAPLTFSFLFKVGLVPLLNVTRS